MENWTEIKIAVNAADIDRAGDIANEVAPSGIYIEDYRDMEQVVEDIAPDVSPAEAVAFLSARYGSEGIAHEIELLDCAEEDWRNNWKQYFHPLAVGKSLMIVPSWYENVDLQGRTPLTIDPGLAFGTGGHETTRLCLEMCEKYMKPGDSVLDVGCGSGILGIAALLCGAKEAVGVDIDEKAVETAAENAELNGVGDRGGGHIRHRSRQHRSGRDPLSLQGRQRLYEARRRLHHERHHRHPRRRSARRCRAVL